MTVLDWVVFCSVFVISFAVSMYGSSAVQDEKMYLVNNGQTRFFPLVATLVMTEFNPSTLLSFAALGYLVGYWALWMPFIFLVGISFYALTVAAEWKKFDGMSVAAFFKERYTPFLATFASVCLLVSMLGFCATYLKSMSLVFQPLFPGFSLEMISFICCGLVVIGTIRGGLLSIIQVDIVSFLLTVLFFPLCFFFVLQKVPSFSIQDVLRVYPLEQVSSQLPFSFVVSLVVLCMFTYPLAPWYGQKMFAARTPKIAKQAALCSSVLVFILYSLAALSCALLRIYGVGVADAEQALPALFSQLVPSGLAGLGFALFFSAGMTTLAGVWSAMTTMCIADFLDLEEPGSTTRSVVITLVIACSSWSLAVNVVDGIFDHLILSNIPVFAMSFALLAGFYMPKADTLSATVSTIVGLVWGVFSYLYWGVEGGYTWYWVMWGVPLVFGSGYFVAIRSNARSWALQ